eukprot:GHVS01050332.1.p1 GENE.GHVS01050332.1~~GHVS01050332.1.p1  ORF type:complete len:115 (-),score=15.11 GHVS01050332.1:954-1298(-)
MAVAQRYLASWVAALLLLYVTVVSDGARVVYTLTAECAHQRNVLRQQTLTSAASSSGSSAELSSVSDVDVGSGRDSAIITTSTFSITSGTSSCSCSVTDKWLKNINKENEYQNS